MKCISFFATLLFATLFSTSGYSQELNASETAAIQAVYKNLEISWNAKDAAQWATSFAPNHDNIVWNGLYFKHIGPVEQEQSHAQLFSGQFKDMNLRNVVDEIRVLSDDLVLLTGFVAGYQVGAEEMPQYPWHIITCVLHKKKGAWKIVSFHASDIEYSEMLGDETPEDGQKIGLAKNMFAAWYN
jgi:uncharacterized protein (TIGR02246 family)